MAYGYMIFCTLPEVSTVYFGITTKTVEERFAQHLWRATNGGSELYLHRAMRKYGVANFKIQEMFVSDSFDSCKEWEVATIKSSRNIGLKLWNLTDGGDGGNGYKWTNEQKLASSLARKGRPSPRKGIPHTEKSRKNMSVAHMGQIAWNKGIPHSMESRQKMSEAQRGRINPPASEETRRKISAAHKGKTLSPEVRQKISLANRGRKLSPETCQKMREAWARRKAAKLLAEAVQTE